MLLCGVLLPFPAPAFPLLASGDAPSGTGIGEIKRKTDYVLRELWMLFERDAYRCVKLRCGFVVPAKEILRLPCGFLAVRVADEVLDPCIAPSALSTMA